MFVDLYLFGGVAEGKERSIKKCDGTWDEDLSGLAEERVRIMKPRPKKSEATLPGIIKALQEGD